MPTTPIVTFEQEKPDYEEVDHPQHYNDHPSGVECITVVEWFDFLLGNAIKYIWRAGHKPGVDVLKDLKKAQWYLGRKIEQLERAEYEGKPHV